VGKLTLDARPISLFFLKIIRYRVPYWRERWMQIVNWGGQIKKVATRILLISLQGVQRGKSEASLGQVQSKSGLIVKLSGL
jgi:hypothetical protein